jgi:hypothetical protein
MSQLLAVTERRPLIRFREFPYQSPNNNSDRPLRIRPTFYATTVLNCVDDLPRIQWV